MKELSVLLFALSCIKVSHSVPFVVQTLSSRYGLVLGGYGPGYKDLRQVEVVRHDRVCSGAIKDVPAESGRFLGDVSGMAEYVNGSVIFCRHSSCWNLNVARNSWKKVICILGTMIMNSMMIKQSWERKLSFTDDQQLHI